MTIRLISILGVTLAVGACGSTTSETSGPSPEEGEVALSAPAGIGEEAGSSLPEYQEIVIPNGTGLLLSLTTSIGSDTSVVEDEVSAELTQAIAVDGREVLPSGTQVEGRVTAVDAGGRVTGRATITFRFASMRVGEEQYEILTAPVSHMAPATRGEDATTIGVGAGAGALIGGLLGGADGAATGAAVGGGAGTGVVLATRGADVRLESGAAVNTELTSPLTVRVPTE